MKALVMAVSFTYSTLSYVKLLKNKYVIGGGGGSRTLFPQGKSLSINSF
jgi:hypothetical protein